MARYRPYAAAYAALYRRQRTTGDDTAIRAQAARILVDQDCTDGRHRVETDSESGNEVCRYCGTVVDDYGDVVTEASEEER